MKIVQIADTQIEVQRTVTGNRYDEFKTGLEKIANQIDFEDKPDLIVYTGDLFQYHTASMEELELAQKFLTKLSNIAPLVLINGNHEFLRASRTGIIKNYKTQTSMDPMEFVVSSINNPSRISYIKRSGFYRDIFGHNFAVWSQFEKFNKDENDQLSYSPWNMSGADKVLEEIENGVLWIELFHDPIRNCGGFDGKPMEHFKNHQITLDSFGCELILAGDIHAPDVIRFGEDKKKLFTFCSSTIMRNFGEGDYWKNSKLFQNGNNMHGYNVVEVTKNNHSNSYEYDVQFKKVSQPVGRHTIFLTKDFKYPQDIESLTIVPDTFNRIRLVIEDNIQEYYEHQDKVIEFLTTKYNAVIDDISWDKNTGIEFDDSLKIEDASKIADKSTILELSKKYIRNVIEKTKTIAEDQKEKAINELNDIFTKELNKHWDDSKNLRKTKIQKATISNFLTFSNDVEVNFDNNGITKISGSNAVGKTKLMSFICWMLDPYNRFIKGQVSSQKKKNHLLIFNKFRSQNWVEGTLEFTVNDQPHILTKRVERQWKKGNNMWKEDDWEKYISGTPTLDISLQSPSLTSTNWEEISEYLSEIMTMEEFLLYTFVNQESLANLLHMNPELLIGEILKILGLNFFENLGSSYEEVRQELLSRNPNPGGTVEAYLEENAKLEESISKFEESKLQLEKTIKDKEDESKQIGINIATAKAQIGNLESEEIITSKIQISNTNILNYQNEIQRLETINLNYQNEIDTLDKNQLESNIKQSKNEIVRLDNLIKDNNIAIANKNNEKLTIVNELNQLVTSLKDQKQIQIDEKQTIINNQTNTSNQLLIDKNNISLELTKRIADDKKPQVDVLKNLIEITRSKRNEMNTITQKVGELTIQISNKSNTIQLKEGERDRLKESTICPMCKQPIIGDSLKEIQSNITIIESEITTMQQELNTMSNEKSILDQSLIQISNDVNHAEINENLQQQKVDNFHKTLNDYPDLMEKDSNLGVQIQELQTSTQTLQNELISFRADETYLQTPQVIEVSKKVVAIDGSIKDLTDAIVNQRSLITEENSKIEQLNSSLQLIQNKKDQISKNSIEIEKSKGSLNIEESNLSRYQDDLNRVKALKNVFDEIKKLENEIVVLDHSKKEYQVQLNNLIIENKSSSLKIVDNKLKIEQIKDHQLANSITRQYKAMLGKSGLQKYVFAKITDIINSKLNQMLSDVNFRLYFDTITLALRKVDMKTGITSDCMLTSGMETSILGLALLDSLLVLNQTKKLDVLFIDEISGQLNSGKDLSYEAKNYQDLLVNILKNISKNTNVYIVDHVLSTLGEKKIIEVQKTNDGSVVQEFNNIIT